jgi:hypothetical protein
MLPLLLLLLLPRCLRSTPRSLLLLPAPLLLLLLCVAVASLALVWLGFDVAGAAVICSALFTKTLLRHRPSAGRLLLLLLLLPAAAADLASAAAAPSAPAAAAVAAAAAGEVTALAGSSAIGQFSGQWP